MEFGIWEFFLAFETIFRKKKGKNQLRNYVPTKNLTKLAHTPNICVYWNLKNLNLCIYLKKKSKYMHIFFIFLLFIPYLDRLRCHLKFLFCFSHMNLRTQEWFLSPFFLLNHLTLYFFWNKAWIKSIVVHFRIYIFF